MVDDEILAVFGKNVHKARQNKKISQEVLAEIAGLDRTYISSMERGKRNVSLLNIIKVADALAISPSQLFQELGEANE